MLEQFGFSFARDKGGHRLLKKPGHRFTIAVPMHDMVKTGTLRSIIRDAGLTRDQFLSAL